jgi:hypothetical protein
MTSILKDLYRFKDVSPRKCPFKDKVPKGEQAYVVPEELRGVLLVWQKRKKRADEAARGNGDERKKWFVLNSEACAVFHIFCEALRVQKGFSINQCVAPCEKWQYTLSA